MFFVQATDKRGIVSLYNVNESRKICVERDGNKAFKIKFYSKTSNESFEILYENESQANQDFEDLSQCLAQHHLFWKCSGEPPN